jgi:hypothetical protein
MTAEPRTVAAARIEVERARGRMMDSARELQDRLSPGTIAHTAWSGAKAKGADFAEDAVDAVKRRPGIAGGVVAAVALFLAREPLLDLAGKLGGQVGDTIGGKGRARRKAAKAGPAKARTSAERTTKDKASRTETTE